ncbi:F-box domain containing protein [Tanacetum coccineum]
MSPPRLCRRGILCHLDGRLISLDGNIIVGPFLFCRRREYGIPSERSQIRQLSVDNDKDPERLVTKQRVYSLGASLLDATMPAEERPGRTHLKTQATFVAWPHDSGEILLADRRRINVDDDGVDNVVLVKKNIDLERVYIEEVIRGVPLYYPSWLKVPKERKAALITDIGTQFDLRPHMESPDWTEINAGIQQHLQKAYNTNKAAFKAQHWVIDPTTGTYNVEKIRRARPEDITAEEWDKYIQFWNDPRNIARAAQNRQNRAKSTVISRQGSRSLARLRDEMRQSSGTQEYPSLIDTFFVAHTVNGEFLRDEDRRIYEEMRRLEATGTYTDDEINRLARRGKQRGHIPGVGRVLPARATAGPSTPASKSTLNSLHKKVDFMMSLFKSDSKYSDMFSQFESGGASGSGGCGDDEETADDQEDEDEDGDGDS